MSNITTLVTNLPARALNASPEQQAENQQSDEPRLPRISNNQFHCPTLSSERALYRSTMKAKAEEQKHRLTLSQEQKDCVTCACFECNKRFESSIRYMYSESERYQAFEKMDDNDIELQ